MNKKTLPILAMTCLFGMSMFGQNVNRNYLVYEEWFRPILPPDKASIEELTPAEFEYVVGNIQTKSGLLDHIVTTNLTVINRLQHGLTPVAADEGSFASGLDTFAGSYGWMIKVFDHHNKRLYLTKTSITNSVEQMYFVKSNGSNPITIVDSPELENVKQGKIYPETDIVVPSRYIPSWISVNQDAHSDYEAIATNYSNGVIYYTGELTQLLSRGRIVAHADTKNVDMGALKLLIEIDSSGNNITPMSPSVADMFDFAGLIKNNYKVNRFIINETPTNGTHLVNWYSVVFGRDNYSVGNFSLVVGNRNASLGDYGLVHGKYNEAGYAAHAEGKTTRALGMQSHSEGIYTIARGSNSHAEGNSTLSLGESSHSEGKQTQALGTGSHSSGFKTKAVGNYSNTEGNTTTSIGQYSHSEGRGSIETSSFTISGIGNTFTSSSAHGLKIGSVVRYNDTFAKIDAVSSTTNFTTSVSLTSKQITNEPIYTVFGIAVGDSSHVEGDRSISVGSYSHAEGIKTKAVGNFSHAEGGYTAAYGIGSHSEGVYANAANNYSFTWNGIATGYDTSNPYTSHGEGTFNINPVGGTAGFYIGDQNFEDVLKKFLVDLSTTGFDYNGNHYRLVVE